MKSVLIASFDMEVGGVERSLINMLDNLDYKAYKVDLMLYRQYGDFLKLLSNKVNLLGEIKEYSSFRKSIFTLFEERQINLSTSRLKAKITSKIYAKRNNFSEEGCVQMQRMWQYALPYLPPMDKKYDVAISYLWPHYFVADRVEADKKIAWIHTDYSVIETDIKEDLRIWNKFNYIMAVSEECKNTFLKKYPELKDKVVVMENIISPRFIRKMAKEEVKEDTIGDNNFKLMTVARLSTAKGIDNAVKALKTLENEGLNNIKWYVVGYGEEKEKIKALIKENNLEEKFILLGKKINPYPYMNSCDLYVQPSRYEGKAVTVKEAQILGKAVIITNYPTAKSQLIHGVDGYICEASIEGIAKGIKQLYNNAQLRDELELNCKKCDYSNEKELDVLYKLFR
jgi:glycosyltransferase involved in cell wall biosynthesis